MKKPLKPSQVLLAAMLAASKHSCAIRRANTQKRHRLAQAALSNEEKSRCFLQQMWHDGWRLLTEGERRVLTKPERRVEYEGCKLGAFNQFYLIDRHLRVQAKSPKE